jgi:REP element-mobilizing transposase RayT
MTHSYSKLLYHIIWSTKNRENYIDVSVKHRLYGYIRAVIHDKDQHLYAINGMPDHIHLLVSLTASSTVSNLIKEIKVSSTKWMHSELNNKRFSWQEGYACYTVGYSTFHGVMSYIENQETHHQSVSFDDEYINMLKMQQIDFDSRFVLG